MTNEERREAVARLLKNAPDVLTPREVAKWTRYGKNTVYAMLKDGTLHGYVFRGSYLVGKEDLIDFMVEQTDDIAYRYRFFE
jgi:excisionase family DNA binding protein